MPHHFMELGIAGIGDGPWYGDEEVQVTAGTGHLQVAGETVEDAANFVSPLFGENRHDIAMGVPVMDDEGEGELSGQGYEAAKDLHLKGTGGPVPVEVQPDFADGHHLGRVLCRQVPDAFYDSVIHLCRIVWMDTDGDKKTFPAGGDREGLSAGG
jgi:hypothetical protein